MNQRDMPAIPEPPHEEPPSPSPSNSTVTSPITTPIHFNDTVTEQPMKEEQENQKPKSPEVGPTSPVAQRLRAWQNKSSSETDSRNTTGTRSSSAGVGGTRGLFVGNGDRGSSSVGRQSPEDPNIRTVSRSSLQANSAPPRASALSPPPRSSSRGAGDKEGAGEDKSKLRNMSPLIAQRMAAFHKSR
jgi:hypothetical protein